MLTLQVESGHWSGWGTLPTGTHPLGSHPLVVRLSALESHESQNLLTPKDVTDSHQSHCHRQQCLLQVVAICSHVCHNSSTTQTTSCILYNTITTCNSNSVRNNYNATLHMTLQRLSLHKDAGYSMELCNPHKLTDAPHVRQHYTHSCDHEVHISCIVAYHTDFCTTQ